MALGIRFANIGFGKMDSVCVCAYRVVTSLAMQPIVGLDLCVCVSLALRLVSSGGNLSLASNQS